ncbi:MAG: T9SS type A sorting domain-containing protein, partial [Chitinophagales bacterium]
SVGKLISAWFPFTTACRLGETIETTLDVFPNPAKESVGFDYFTGVQELITINVLDVSGKVYISEIKTAEPGLNSFEIGLDNFESGMYFVQIKSGDKQIIDKFIVTK